MKKFQLNYCKDHNLSQHKGIVLNYALLRFSMEIVNGLCKRN